MGRVAVVVSEWNRYRILPLFLSVDGKVYMQTAKHVWDQLLAYDPVVFSTLDAIASQSVLAKLQSLVEEEVRPIYETLKHEHAYYLTNERNKAARAFAARRSVIERIGLPQVRRYRLNLLAQEERHLFEQLENRA